MRKKYLSALLFGALLVTSAGTFTSCKDYDDEINDLQEQINKVVADLESLKSEVDKLGGYVTDVKVENGKLVVTVEGEEPVAYELPAGAEMEEIKIENNHLYVGDKDLGQVTGEVTVKDGVLMIGGEEAGLKVGTEVIIKDSSNGIYTIQIGDETIQLPMASANVQVTLDDGKVFDNFKWGVVPENAAKWRGENQTAGTVLMSEDEGLKISVTPYSYELDNQTLKLVDTTGKYADVEITPEALGKAEDGKPATSRTISYSGEWNLSIKMKNATVDGNKITNYSTDDGNKLYALEISGKVVTPYSFTIVPGTKDATNIVADNVELYLNGSETAFDANDDALSITKDNVFTASTQTDNIVADSYLVFEGAMADKAKAYGVEIVDDMTIRASEKAAAKKDLKVKLYTLGVNGSVASKEIKLLFATSEVEAGEVSAEDHKVTVDGTKSFLISVENYFTADDVEYLENSGTSVNADATDVPKGLSFTIEDENEDPLFKGSSNVFSYELFKDKECKSAFDKEKDAVADLKFIKLVKSGSYNDKAKEGTYTITMTLRDASKNEVKKATADLKVVLPKWDDVFVKRQSEWNTEGTALNVLTTVSGSNDQIDMPNPGEYLNTTSDYNKIVVNSSNVVLSLVNPTADKTSLSGTTITLKDDVLKDGQILKDIPAKYEYSFGGELKINSGTFNIHPYSRVDDFELKYYVNDNSTDIIEVEYDQAQNAGSGGIVITDFNGKTGGKDKEKAGLALVANNKEYKFNSGSVDGLSLKTNTEIEILTSGYEGTACIINDNVIYLYNETSGGPLKDPSTATGSYDIKIQVKVTDGAIVNTAEYTVRVK